MPNPALEVGVASRRGDDPAPRWGRGSARCATSHHPPDRDAPHPAIRAMPLDPRPRPATLMARESEARAAMRRLRACGRDIERLDAQLSAGRHHRRTEVLDERLHALRAEADHIRLELAQWDVAGSPLWTQQVQMRLERLSSAITAVREDDPFRRQRQRVRVWPGRAAMPSAQLADEVERAVYEHLYPRSRPTPAVG